MSTLNNFECFKQFATLCRSPRYKFPIVRFKRGGHEVEESLETPIKKGQWGVKNSPVYKARLQKIIVTSPVGTTIWSENEGRDEIPVFKKIREGTWIQFS